MGDIAEMHLDGTLCRECGTYIDKPNYHESPRRCDDCKDEYNKENKEG